MKPKSVATSFDFALHRSIDFDCRLDSFPRSRRSRLVSPNHREFRARAGITFRQLRASRFPFLRGRTQRETLITC